MPIQAFPGRCIQGFATNNKSKNDNDHERGNPQQQQEQQQQQQQQQQPPIVFLLPSLQATDLSTPTNRTASNGLVQGNQLVIPQVMFQSVPQPSAPLRTEQRRLKQVMSRAERCQQRQVRQQQRQQQRKQRKEENQKQQMKRQHHKEEEIKSNGGIANVRPSNLNITHEIEQKDNEKCFKLKMDVPKDKQYLTVSVGPHGHVMRIVGRKDKDQNPKDDTDANRFIVAFKVGGKLDTTKLPHGAKATLCNGVLTVYAPKVENLRKVTTVVISETLRSPSSISKNKEYVPMTSIKDMTMNDKEDDAEEGEEGMDLKEAAEEVDNEEEKEEVDNDYDDDFVDVTMDINENNKTDGATIAEAQLLKKVIKEQDMSKQASAAASPPTTTKNPIGMFQRVVDVPGVRLEDLKVEHECDGRILRVSGIRRASTGLGRDRNFEKIFRLRPMKNGIDMRQMTASLELGVLSITAPKYTTSVAEGLKRKQKGKREKGSGSGGVRFFIPVTVLEKEVSEEEISVGVNGMVLEKGC